MILKDIPLLYSKDIKELGTLQSLSSDELYILCLGNALETKIQQECKKIFDIFIKPQAKTWEMDFMQVDNGGKQTMAGRMRKKAEGTIRGASDVIIWLHNNVSNNTKILLFEFKRIDVPSKVEIRQDQIDFQKRWKDIYKCDGYITNNPLFFKEVIENIIKENNT